MHSQDGLSSTHEMYLKVLYRLQLENEVGRVRDMAKGLGVTASTVSVVLKKLEQASLVIHDRYGTVKLTAAGYRVAECVVRRFEILKSLLVTVLGVDVETAELDACMMEHAVSPATINRMERLIELAKAGELDLHSIHAPVVAESTCSDCASAGTCQAIASLDTSLDAVGRN